MNFYKFNNKHTICSILRYYVLNSICGALGVSGHGLPFLLPIGVTSFPQNNFVQKQNHNSRIKQDVSTVASRLTSDTNGAQRINTMAATRLKAKEYVKKYTCRISTR